MTVMHLVNLKLKREDLGSSLLVTGEVLENIYMSETKVICAVRAKVKANLSMIRNAHVEISAIF